jgi:hypothetical protein
MIATESYQL